MLTSRSSSRGSRAPGSIGHSSSVATPRNRATTRRPGAPAGDGRDRSPARRDRDPGLPQGHAFIADGPLLEALRAKAAFASYMTTQLCFDPGAIATWLAARRAEGITLRSTSGVPGRRRAAATAGDQRADRGRRHAPVSRQEHTVHRAVDPVRRVLSARRAARRAGAAHRRPGEPDRRPAHVHVQRGRRHRARGGWHTSSGYGSRPQPKG